MHSARPVDVALFPLAPPAPRFRPHYHCWLVAVTGTMAYMSRPFGTKQAAHAWGARRQPPAFRFVQRCDMKRDCPRQPKGETP